MLQILPMGYDRRGHFVVNGPTDQWTNGPMDQWTNGPLVHLSIERGAGYRDPVPSPLGHGLAAVATGWAISGMPAAKSAFVRQTAILVAVGIAPDLDLLIGRHSMETHSIGAAVVVASIAAWQRWPVAPSRMMTWLAVALAWMSHP